MFSELDLPNSLNRRAQDAAAAAMLHAGRRLNASADDIDTVCDALFAEVQS